VRACTFITDAGGATYSADMKKTLVQ